MFLLKVFFYKEFFHEAEATTSVLINSNHNASIIKGANKVWLCGYLVIILRSIITLSFPADVH